MILRMHEPETLSLAEMQVFLRGSEMLVSDALKRTERYALVAAVLARQQYAGLGKRDKIVVRAYLAKVTGLKRAQINRLVGQFRRTGTVRLKEVARPHFPRRYTPKDIELLAATDVAHERLSGPATCRLLKRAHEEYGDPAYERLAKISVSHLYVLRATDLYRRKALPVIQPTKSVIISFGERRKPDPQGQPGYLRVDTVHQGRQGGAPGPFHINCVDTITQWQIVGCCERLLKETVTPLLRTMIAQFPFVIRGFHCDNGHEFLNDKVVDLLNSLLIQLTKSRPYHSMDNALVEGKNGAVIRKHMGYGLLRPAQVRSLGDFYRQHFNPYVNFHRPCGFAEVHVSEHGKRRRVYRAKDYKTPYEKLISLPNWTTYLRPDVDQAALQRQAVGHTDLEAARLMQEVKYRIFGDALVLAASQRPFGSSKGNKA